MGGVNRRISTLAVALVPIMIFGALLWLVTVPYVALGPGPTFNTLGEVEGMEVVDIEGTEVHPTSGHLNMTTVSQRDQLSLLQALVFWASGRDQLVPRDLVYPPNRTRALERKPEGTADQADTDDSDGGVVFHSSATRARPTPSRTEHSPPTPGRDR